MLAEIETDKANMEMEALGSGVLRKILVPAGGKAPVGALIGVIAEPNEDISHADRQGARRGRAARTRPRRLAAPAPAPAPQPPLAPREPALRPAAASRPPAPAAPRCRRRRP